MSDQLPGTTAPASGSAGTGAATALDPTPSAPAEGASGADRDWTVQVTERVGSVVGTVRDKTTVPITKVTRIVVFGLVAAVVGLIALILTIIGVVRVIDVYLPFAPYGRRVWIGYAGLGAIFLLFGAFSWSKRTRKPQETQT
jgi:hypothetical protein